MYKLKTLKLKSYSNTVLSDTWKQMKILISKSYQILVTRPYTDSNNYANVHKNSLIRFTHTKKKTYQENSFAAYLCISTVYIIRY